MITTGYLKLLDGTIFKILGASEAPEEMEGISRSVITIQFPNTYNSKELFSAFSDSSNISKLVIGKEGENKSDILWLSPSHDHYSILVRCGYERLDKGQDLETGNKIFEDSLVVKLAKLTPEEITIKYLTQTLESIEDAVVQYVFGD